MKQCYLLLLFALFSSILASAQILANDDFFTNVNGTSGITANSTPQYVITTNDLLNGSTFGLGSVIITQISTTDPAVYIVGNRLRVNAGTPAGNYTVVYSLCQATNPINCDTATISVSICNIESPTVVLPSCSSPAGQFTLNGMPSTGNWTLVMTSSTDTMTTTGTGTSTTVNAPPGSYYCQVTNAAGCLTPSFFVNTYSIGGITGTMTGTYQDFNNDGITNVGDIIILNYAITNTLDCPINNIIVDPSFINSGLYGSPIASIAAGATDTTVSATYVLTQNNINNGQVNLPYSAVSATTNGGSAMYIKLFNNTAIDLNIADGIKLNLFYDTNGNGVQNGTEQNTNFGPFHVQTNGGVVRDLFTNNGTLYLYESNPANSYNLSCTLHPFSCSEQYSITPSSYSNITVPAGSGLTTYNFPITTVPCDDLLVYMYSDVPRPGNTYTNTITYRNNGNQTLASGTITFTKDAALTITNISQTGTTATANGFSYNFTNLLPNQSRTITVQMLVPTLPTVVVGQLLTTTVTASTPVSESSLANNSYSITESVRTSYDPNDITESHGNKILHSAFTANDYLNYTIRFENTGNANAINIHITDLLDDKLEPTSVRMTGSSDNYILERTGNVLEWKFNGINLPPSTPANNDGKGYLTYQVKPKPGYAVGDIIPNAASIYFDTNPAIITETCLSEFVNSLKTDDFAFNNFRYSPNPVKNVLSLSNNNTIEKVTITSVLGQKVLEKKTNSLQADVDFSGLDNGIYLVKVSAANQLKTFKIVKQ